MLYHYLASDKDEKVVEGNTDAEQLEGVLRYLAGKNLRPISVKPVKEIRLGIRRAWGGISLTDKIFLTKYMALMLRVGTDLLSAVNILIADFEKPSVRNFLLEVRDNLVAGRPFFHAFERYPKYFSPVFVNLVRAAEASGNLQKTFEDLSDSLTREADLRGKIRSATVYPVILIVLGFGLFGFISVYAIPKVSEIFEESEGEIPIFSRIVFSVGNFFNDHFLVIVFLALVLSIGGAIFFLKTITGKKVVQQIFRHTPIVKTVAQQIIIQRFAATFSSLMRAGLPIVQAIEITADTVGSEEFRASLYRVSREGLSRGLTIGDAFRRELVFPRVVTNLIAISEKAGHLEEILETLATFYTSSIESSIKTLVSFLEPALLLSIGLLVALLALSVIVPIYQLTTAF